MQRKILKFINIYFRSYFVKSPEIMFRLELLVSESSTRSQQKTNVRNLTCAEVATRNQEKLKSDEQRPADTMLSLPTYSFYLNSKWHCPQAINSCKSYFSFIIKGMFHLICLFRDHTSSEILFWMFLHVFEKSLESRKGLNEPFPFTIINSNPFNILHFLLLINLQVNSLSPL